MTTEAETRRFLNSVDIPEDLADELTAGRIVFMMPFDTRSRTVSTDDIEVIAASFHEVGGYLRHEFDRWSHLSRALGQAGYTIVESPRSSVEIVPVRVGQDAAGAIERYHERLAELEEAAEEEGIERSADSEQDFRAFVASNPDWRKAALGLMENGNLRAVWKGDDGSHLGLQFMGGQFGEYVIFKRRSETIPVSRVSGVDTLDGVIAQVGAFNLDEMVIE